MLTPNTGVPAELCLRLKWGAVLSASSVVLLGRAEYGWFSIR